MDLLNRRLLLVAIVLGLIGTGACGVGGIASFTLTGQAIALAGVLLTSIATLLGVVLLLRWALRYAQQD